MANIINARLESDEIRPVATSCRSHRPLLLLNSRTDATIRTAATYVNCFAKLTFIILLATAFIAHRVVAQVPSSTDPLLKLTSTAVLGSWHYDIISKKTAKLKCRFTFAYRAGGIGNLTIAQQSPKHVTVMPLTWYSNKGGVIMSFSKEKTASGAFFGKDKLFGQLSPDAKSLTVAWPSNETEPMTLHR